MIEIAECQCLVKGYGDTTRAASRTTTLMDAIDRIAARPDLAQLIRQPRNAALADEEGERLRAALAELERPAPEAA